MSLAVAIRRQLPEGVPSGVANADDLLIINQYANPPLSSEDVFVFPCTACTYEYRKDQPWRFGLSSLQNFAADLQTGVPYLIGHDTDERNGGYSYGGYFDPETKEVRAAVYLVRDFPLTEAETTETEIEAIQKGLRRAVSVGPAGMGKWMCDLCNEDVFGSICPHIPGASYEGRLCTATVEELRLVELSGAFAGAVPGTDILRAKAQRQKRQGLLSASVSLDWLNRLQVAEKAKVVLPALADASAETTTPPAVSGKKETVMRDKLAAALMRLGLNRMAAAVLGATEEDPEGLAQKLSAEVGSEVEAKIAAHPLLSALAAAEVKTSEAINTLLNEAKAGREYDAKVNETLTAAANRHFDTPEQAQAAVTAYKHLDIPTKLATAEQWEQSTDQRFRTNPNTHAQRQTAPVALPTYAVDASNAGEPVLSEGERSNVRAAVGGKPARNGGN
jgi:hypothetical protein